MPVSYRGISIEIGAETTELQKALGEIREKTKNTYAGLRDVNKLLKFDDTNVVGLTQKQQYLSEAIEATKDRQELYRKGMESLKQVEEEHGSLTDQQKAQYEQLERSYERCGSQIKSYSEDLERTNTALQTSTEQTTQLSDQMSTLGDRMQAVGSKLSGIGDKLTIGLTVPLVAGAKTAVDAAVDIDSAFHDLSKTVDGTDEELQGFKDAAIELSKTQPVSASEIMQIEAMGGQLGIANENLQDFATTVSGLSIASDLGTEEAAMSLAQFANVTGMAQEDADRYGSTIVDLGNHYAATESQITDMSDRVAAAGTQIGLSEADVLGLSTALVAMGINAEAGGTAISTVMSNIDKDVATQSENLSKWAAIAHMSAEDFANTWKSDPISALQAVFAGLESATEAGGNMNVMLEELGISSIRQTDMMKRLSSNSQLLTQAVSDANTAWEQNTALTTEVDKRNESLASQMDVLKNRATAVAAEMGEPLAGALLGILNAAEPLIKLVESGAQAFADLSTGQQQLIVAALALSAALGPVTSVTGRVIEGMGGIVSAAGTGVGAIKNFVTSLGEGKTAMDLAALSAEGLQVALGGIEVLAIVYVITEVIGRLEEMREHMETVQQATEGLVSSTEAMNEAYDGTGTGTETASMSLRDMADAANECLEAQAQLAETSRDTWSEIGTNAGLVDSYVQSIEELTSKSSLTAEEQTRLQQAVQNFNDMTGAAVSITNAQTGELNLQADAIKATSEAYKERARVQAAEELYAENQKQYIRNQQEIADLERQITQTQKEHSIVLGETGWEISNLIGDELDAYREMVARKDELVNANAFLESSEAELLSMMSASGRTFATVEEALAASGLAEAAYANLTEEQMARVRAAFDGTVGSVVRAVNQINSSMGSIGTGGTSYTPATISVPTYTGGGGGGGGGGRDDSAYKDQQKEYDREYKELQKQLDKIYKAKQKSYDAEYQALQKQLDKVYKARQKELDKEYDELQSQLDAQYDAVAAQYSAEEKLLKDQLDEAYKLRKEQLDAEYKERQKALNAQYDQRKKAYDAQYNQRKKVLDKEYKELQKQNDKILKAAKAANAAETKAFKEATKERISAIKAEYEARKKYVEETDGTSDIDDRIASLEAETKAEQAEIAARERAEKTAELTRAVEQAKTRRTRQDAEQALSDYLAQLAQEDREAQRAAEIERLEEQKELIREETAAKQEALDDERDARIAAYETQREDELSALNERQDAAYEALQAELDAQEELYKEANDGQLAALKEAQQAKLDALKEANDGQLAALKESQTAELDSMRNAADEQLQAMKDQHASQLEVLREHNQSRLEALRESQQTELERLKDHQQERLNTLKESQQEQLESLKESQQEQLEALKEAQQEALEGLRDAMGDAGGALSDGLADMGGTLDSELQDQQGSVDNALSDTAKGIESGMRDATNNIGNALRTITGNVSDETRRAADEATENGGGAGHGFAGGLESAGGTVLNEARALADTVADELGEVSRNSRDWGYDAGENFASGLSSTINSVINAAYSLADSVASYLHFSVPDKGPLSDEDEWGEDLVQNLIDGMVSKERRLAREAERMAQIVEKGFDPTLSVGDVAGMELARQTRNLSSLAAMAASSKTVVYNISFEKPVIREDLDIKRITQQITSAIARTERGKLK